LTEELKVIQEVYDLIKWYIPLLNRLPRDHKFLLGDRVGANLYDILDSLIEAKYSREKVALLQDINTRLERLRFQTRLLHDFGCFSTKRYEYASGLINGIGLSVGGWLRHQKGKA